MFRIVLFVVLFSVLATQLSQSVPRNLDDILRCTERRVAERKWLVNDPRPFDIRNWDDDITLLTGRLGWHATWRIAFKTDQGRVQAYDTFDRSKGRPFARRAVPNALKRLIVVCGAEWAGLWPTGG